MNFTFHAPLNSLSFGQASLNILQEFFKKGLNPLVLSIGNIDIKSFNNPEEGFFPWLQERVNEGAIKHTRDIPTIKLWHLESSLESVSCKQALLTFHETDELTPFEANIAKNQSKVLLTSDFSKKVFEDSGLNNIERVNLGFDSRHFKKTIKKYHDPSVIYFGLAGKLENRKRHLDVLRLWAKKYGNKKEYFLNCALFNPFLKPEVQQQLVAQALEGVYYYNIIFNPFMDTNSTYNDFLNSNDVIIGMSGGEGWGLPEFQSVALGKHSVILNASAYKSWATPDNSVLVEPLEKKIPCYDNVFFHQGRPFNQGNFYTWSDESLYNALEQAIQRVRINKTNQEGIKLQEDFTWTKTADKILDVIKEIS